MKLSECCDMQMSCQSMNIFREVEFQLSKFNIFLQMIMKIVKVSVKKQLKKNSGLANKIAFTRDLYF